MRQWFSRNKSRIQKWFIATLLLAIVIALVAYGINKRDSIEPGDVMQIMILVALVVVTGAYAWSASRQADASVKMGEEMRKQRYDMVRPVIDFEGPATGEELIAEGFAAKAQDYNHGLKRMLCNIGIGPAIDIYSFINPTYGTRQLHNFGTIAAGDIKTYGWNFHLEQRDNLWFLLAYYRDIHGRCFESKREVIADVDKEGWILDPLENQEITKEEYQRGKQQ